jgi:antitoxin HicB
MKYEYPAILTKDDNETIIAEFPDVPEAITIGFNEKSALMWGRKALIMALETYVERKLNIPIPSKPKKGQKTVSVSICFT